MGNFISLWELRYSCLWWKVCGLWIAKSKSHFPIFLFRSSRLGLVLDSTAHHYSLFFCGLAPPVSVRKHLSPRSLNSLPRRSRHYRLEAELSAMSWRIRWEELLGEERRKERSKHVKLNWIVDEEQLNPLLQRQDSRISLTKVLSRLAQKKKLFNFSL